MDKPNPPFAPKISSMAGPDLRLRVQPYVKLLELHYPVDDLLLAVKAGNDQSISFASNAVQDRRKHTEVQAAAKQKSARSIPRRTSLGFLCLFPPHQPERVFAVGFPAEWKVRSAGHRVGFSRERGAVGRSRIIRSTFVSKPGQLWAGSVSKMRTFGP